MIRPNPLLKVDVAEKLASPLIPTPHHLTSESFGRSESLNEPNRDPLLQQPASREFKAEKPVRDDVKRRITLAERLLAEGFASEAFILTWTALEAILRDLVEPNGDEKVERDWAPIASESLRGRIHYGC